MQRKSHLPAGVGARHVRPSTECCRGTAVHKRILPDPVHPPALGRLTAPQGCNFVSLLAELHNPRPRVNDVEKPHRLQRCYATAHLHRLEQAGALMRSGVLRPVGDDAAEQ
ncbi:hypothetical protein BVI2075_160008 [Burkholderia vietnamiensis]|nr:hypothetical protein BVI2075_160008 [Burkholderia vietnamiensis]